MVEVACDESGYEGDKLIGATTRVFAHASVRLDADAAADCMQELRNRIRSPATEYKATHVLREKHRSVLSWLLGAAGPLHGNARVYLIDKTFFVLGKMVDLLEDGTVQPSGFAQHHDRRAKAVRLYRDGPRAFGAERWDAFLVAANNVLRAKERIDGPTTVDQFVRAVQALVEAGVGDDGLRRLLAGARPQAESFRARLLADPTTGSAMDPLIPAIVQAVGHWGGGVRPVVVVHDRQTTLSEERIAQIKEISSLAGLGFADSRWDARVQMADVVAGAVRKIAENELSGRGDALLTALLPPYVDGSSIWADDRSWALLQP